MDGMMPGERKNRFATLQIDECNHALPDDIAPSIRWVRDVETAIGHERKGWATKLMTKVCKEADKSKVSLMLEPNSYGDMPDEDLQRWYYKKFGFITVQPKTKGLPCLMFRQNR